MNLAYGYNEASPGILSTVWPAGTGPKLEVAPTMMPCGPPTAAYHRNGISQGANNVTGQAVASSELRPYPGKSL
ncbi:hypothetical protein TTRE_0000435901 [Trichuris trichiura]|uniref:Uncharacterized protein n=1 Tax=Trichuris trichiura TaxID=36087 RepID=A0A077ZBV7_TRITR|nr:hypothetical protein TTRE_0000435901 [Trichuris trichiura]